MWEPTFFEDIFFDSEVLGLHLLNSYLEVQDTS